ncbi:MAG: serine/threonine-protein kinase, partial [Cyanobacteria bacterium J06631_2]
NLLLRLMQGSLLNGIYQIESQLSQRGSRATYLAQNLDTNEPVVIKILKFGFDAEWSDFRLFAREAQTLKNITHPAIPNYLDYFELDLPNCKGFALVQEYIAASSLEAAVKTGRTFSESEIKDIATALLNILLYLHQQQPSIIHRDIKPSNVLLSDRSGNSVGQIYLIDFGAVKSAAAAESGTITVVGTYGYMPPEQFGGRTTPMSDLYSVGATLIYLATGKHPTELPSKDGKINFAALVQLSNSFISWLEQMIEPSCDLRFKFATEALQALQKPTLAKKIQPKVEIVKQPEFSKIGLRKTSSRFNATIPAPGFTIETIFFIAFCLFWNGFLVVWTGFSLTAPFPINIFFPLFSIPFWGVGLFLAGTILFTLFGKTKLKITPEQISLTYECLGLRRQHPKPTDRQNIMALEVADLKAVNNNNSGMTQASFALIIWTNSKAYTLKSSINSPMKIGLLSQHYDPAELEMKWLAQELSQWLNIPLTKKKPDFLIQE